MGPVSKRPAQIEIFGDGDFEIACGTRHQLDGNPQAFRRLNIIRQCGGQAGSDSFHHIDAKSLGGLGQPETRARHRAMDERTAPF